MSEREHQMLTRDMSVVSFFFFKFNNLINFWLFLTHFRFGGREQNVTSVICNLVRANVSILYVLLALRCNDHVISLLHHEIWSIFQFDLTFFNVWIHCLIKLLITNFFIVYLLFVCLFLWGHLHRPLNTDFIHYFAQTMEQRMFRMLSILERVTPIVTQYSQYLLCYE